jgi:hypothetical protein
MWDDSSSHGIPDRSAQFREAKMDTKRALDGVSRDAIRDEFKVQRLFLLHGLIDRRAELHGVHDRADLLIEGMLWNA